MLTQFGAVKPGSVDVLAVAIFNHDLTVYAFDVIGYAAFVLGDGVDGGRVAFAVNVGNVHLIFTIGYEVNHTKQNQVSGSEQTAVFDV